MEMSWERFLQLWCGLWLAVALGRTLQSLLGLTAEQRAVRYTGRIDRVGELRHGGSAEGGIPVVVGYGDAPPVTVTNDGTQGERGEPITTAWVGREVGVVHPPRRPHAHRFTTSAEPPGRGLGWAAFALFLAYAGAVALVAVERAWPWALIGSGGPLALWGLVQLPVMLREKSEHLRRLDRMEAVPGRITAVLRDVSIDQDDGQAVTTLTPVLVFTTRAGQAVTAHCTTHLPRTEGVRGREVTVHHDPADPADFTLDPDADRRARSSDVTVLAIAVLLLAGTAVVGVLLL
ncbi:DUF3592 domain-containing protein [Kitasatospora sp. NPDC088391]|uniref:DUF3592 domain-containing protein n=1 Tax=Kitasatospora sp. NPDC088391 TaxID=3364074 RepID=UPI0038284FB8